MNVTSLRLVPIVGRLFGKGRFALASVPVTTKGRHVAKYCVVEPGTGGVLSVAFDKAEALDAARTVLAAAQELARLEAARDADLMRQGELWPVDTVTPLRVVDKRRPVSRRRRDIFAKSCGRCHYCSGMLVLDGQWHVEHMLPRALGGADEITNLVAACAPCNLAKSDRTAIEYVMQREAGAQQSTPLARDDPAGLS